MKTRLTQAIALVLALSLATSLLGRPPVAAQTEVPEETMGEGTELTVSPILTDTLDATLAITTSFEVGLDEPDPPLEAEQQSEGWTSGQTSVSELGAIEREFLLGVPLEVIDWEEAQQGQEGVRLAASYTYPSSLDWRDSDGGDWTTPIRDQSSCGSCVAFGTAGAIESRLEIAHGNPDLNPDLSEAHLYFCGSGSTCRSGWYPSAALDFARNTGVVDEACYPYSDYDQACSVCPDWESRVTKISGWVGVTDVAQMKQTLADDGPFEVTMLVYTDFFYYTGGVYEYTWGRLIGAHAVTIVGYDDDAGYWIAKNSWGTDWGENGWFRIAYGQCAIDRYAYVPLVQRPTPSFQVITNVSPDEGGTVISEPFACVADGCEQGTEVVLTAVPEGEYHFVGWDGDASGTSESIQLTIDSDKTVTALFSAVACAGCTERTFIPIVASYP